MQPVVEQRSPRPVGGGADSPLHHGRKDRHDHRLPLDRSNRPSESVSTQKRPPDSPSRTRQAAAWSADLSCR